MAYKTRNIASEARSLWFTMAYRTRNATFDGSALVLLYGLYIARGILHLKRACFGIWFKALKGI